MSDAPVLLRELVAEYAKTLAVPMSLIDGRPWVPSHAEAHPDVTPNGCGACAFP